MAKVKQIYEVFEKVVKGIQAIPELQLLGPPEACCVSFIGKGNVNALKVVDWMEEKKGWKNINRLQRPACAQIQIGAKTGFDVDTFIVDLKEAATVLAANPDVRD